MTSTSIIIVYNFVMWIYLIHIGDDDDDGGGFVFTQKLVIEFVEILSELF